MSELFDRFWKRYHWLRCSDNTEASNKEAAGLAWLDEVAAEIERLKDQVSELQTINGKHEQLIREMVDALTDPPFYLFKEDDALIKEAREASKGDYSNPTDP